MKCHLNNLKGDIILWLFKAKVVRPKYPMLRKVCKVVVWEVLVWT